MNIILDGLDASGKTTLAEKLIQNYKFTDIVHSGKDEVTGYSYFIDLLNKNNNTIFDRFNMSEYIFPKIYGRKAKLSDIDYNKINKKIIDTNTLYIVFICSNMSIINNRLIDRHEEHYFEEMNDQQEQFSKYAEEFKNTYKYDNFYIIDIASENSYDKLDKWLYEKLSNE